MEIDRDVITIMLAVPVPELDSEADALAWCVRLVGEHTGDWWTELRDAMQAVDRLRAEGPST